MYKNLLVPLDGSAIANAALLQAIELAEVFNASLTMVAVYDPYPVPVPGPDFCYALVEYLAAVKASAHATIQDARKTVEAAGLQADGLVIESTKPWRGILDTAAAKQSDLIVMGSHGRCGLDKLLMGSVAQHVLQRTHLPVLVVRG